MKKSDHLKLDTTVFYALEKAIKSYRQFAQRNIKECGLEITIDQWLILKTIYDEPGLTQKEIAQKVFKDYASITRMIELLVRRGFLSRSFHPTDRRRFELKLSTEGRKIFQKLIPIVSSNRQTALQNVSDEQIKILHQLLLQITNNCIE